MFKQLKDTVWGSILTAIMIIIIGAALVGLAIGANQLIFEPSRQSSFQFEVASKLTDWCSASPTDPFNVGTLASLKANKDGEPKRFAKLPFAMQQSIESAIRGDHAGACGN